MNKFNTKISRWKRAQEVEKRFWENLAQDLRVDLYSIQVHYDRLVALILKKLPFEIEKSWNVLDVGCGPLSILNILDCNVKVGIDPLLEFYRNKFKLSHNIKWIQNSIENINRETDNIKFDCVFLLNVLDHCQTPKIAISKIKSMLKNGSYLVITLHCHKRNWLKRYWQWFSYRIDPMHTSPLTREDFHNLCKNDFRVILSNRYDLKEMCYWQKRIYPTYFCNRQWEKSLATMKEKNSLIDILLSWPLILWGWRGIHNEWLFVCQKEVR